MGVLGFAIHGKYFVHSGSWALQVREYASDFLGERRKMRAEGERERIVTSRALVSVFVDMVAIDYQPPTWVLEKILE